MQNGAMGLLEALNLQQNFIFIALGAAALFVVYFVRLVNKDSENKRMMAELSDDLMGGPGSLDGDFPSEEELFAQEKPRFKSAKKKREKVDYGDPASLELTVNIPENGDVRDVQFNFSGHSFDAYEALGVNRHDSLEVIEAAYNKALEEVEPKSREFVELAYLSIKKHQNT